MGHKHLRVIDICVCVYVNRTRGEWGDRDSERQREGGGWK